MEGISGSRGERQAGVKEEEPTQGGIWTGHHRGQPRFHPARTLRAGHHRGQPRLHPARTLWGRHGVPFRTFPKACYRWRSIIYRFLSTAGWGMPQCYSLSPPWHVRKLSARRQSKPSQLFPTVVTNQRGCWQDMTQGTQIFWWRKMALIILSFFPPTFFEITAFLTQKIAPLKISFF